MSERKILSIFFSFSVGKKDKQIQICFGKPSGTVDFLTAKYSFILLVRLKIHHNELELMNQVFK